MSKMQILIFVQLLSTSLLQVNAQEKSIEELSDAPNDSLYNTNQTFPLSYSKAIEEWKTVEDINNWIQYNFRYSMERAKNLAENSLNRSRTNIYTPEELYSIKKGICVDLSRFSVETLNKIDSTINAQYLMINFEPITIDGKIIRKHWITVYQENDKFYFLGDSKRPGHIAGPYEKPGDFIIEYEKNRGRKIKSWKVLPNYKKVRKKKIIKQ